jgi:4-hydroxybenzoate polyprenyltransferase
MTVRGAVFLVRPANLLGLALIAVASVFWSGFESWGLVRLLAYVLGCMLVAAGGYAFNDSRDIALDRVAHQHRPIVLGQVTQLFAQRLSLVAGLSGVLLLTWVNTTFLLLASLTAALLFVYSVGLKDRFGFVGNLLTGGLVAAIPLFAGVHAHRVLEIIPVAAVGFGLTLSREILKDVEDRSADVAGGRRTLATAGRTVLIRVLVAASVLLAAASAGWLIARPVTQGAVTTAILLVLAVAPIGAVGRWFLRPQAVHATQRIIKLAMFGYSVAFLAMAAPR